MRLVKKYLKQLATFGILGGLLNYLFFILLYFFGIKAFDQAYRMDFWMPMLFAFMAIYYAKKAEYSYIKFGEAFLVGSFTTLVFVILSCLGVYVHVSFFDNTFFEQSVLSAVETLQSNLATLTDKEDIRMVKESSAYLLETTEELYVLDKAVKLLGITSVFILILSVLLRKSNAGNP